MTIVVDDKIPYIMPALQALADEVVAKAGSEICPEDVRDADILAVRTRTRCDQTLLEGSRVKLVVTATIGFDHLDTDYLDRAGIRWSNCPGCNATSVGQYVRNSLLALQQDKGLDICNSTIGIVGVGHVGTAVWQALKPFIVQGKGQLLLCDPLREPFTLNVEDHSRWCDLHEIQEQADIITFHTPLTTDGAAPTFHMADTVFMTGLRRHPVIINAARGGVIDEHALLQAMDEGLVSHAVIDTWEQEPDINPELLRRAFIATPHIAGYSADGKANATRMTLATICRFIGKPMRFEVKAPALPHDLALSAVPVTRALQLYDPRSDSNRLKEAPEKFEWLRGHYPLRREQATD